MVTRRQFIKSVAATGTSSLAAPVVTRALPSRTAADFFNVHPYIENNPDAVFIMRTNVDVKTNSEAIKNTALDFSRSVFVPSDSGIPLTHMIPIKPNLTCSVNNNYSIEHGMGIVTDVNFTEGVIEGMKELGIGGEQFYIREVNCHNQYEQRGYNEELMERTGVNIRNMEAKVGVISENDLVWVDTPDGIWYRKIPYLWPVNAPDTFFLNIAKLKTHGMGVTLTTKNVQGCIAHNYQRHCVGYNLNMEMDSYHRNPNALADIKANHARHLNDMKVPRWDKSGTSWNSGIGMESWASRAIDNNNATPTGLHIIEGVYGRDGNFQTGPHKEDGTMDLNNKNLLAKDYMSNVIIFGKNHFNVDNIGHWIAGHEPGNFGLFHIGVDMGLTNYINPHDIPVYEWTADGTATLTDIDEFQRTPLLTYYLQKTGEDYWHMVDEHFDYASVSVEQPMKDDRPEAIVLSQNRPNPFNPNTSIEFTIQSAGNTRLEVYNASGQLVDVLADGYHRAGSHMAVWNTSKQSSGIYFYRLRHNGFSEMRKMTLLK